MKRKIAKKIFYILSVVGGILFFIFLSTQELAFGWAALGIWFLASVFFDYFRRCPHCGEKIDL